MVNIEDYRKALAKFAEKRQEGRLHTGRGDRRDFLNMVEEIKKIREFCPERRHHLKLTQSELTEYQQVEGKEAILELDQIFFDRHGTALSFERPAFPSDPFAFPGVPGRAIVFWISSDGSFIVLGMQDPSLFCVS